VSRRDPEDAPCPLCGGPRTSWGCRPVPLGDNCTIKGLREDLSRRPPPVPATNSVVDRDPKVRATLALWTPHNRLRRPPRDDGTLVLDDVRSHSETLGSKVLLKRFGSFPAALAAAGLNHSRMANRWTEDDYLENLRQVWRTTAARRQWRR